MTNHDFDIVVAGGGLVGASVALSLAPWWRVALVERAAPPVSPNSVGRWDNRIYAVSPGSRAFLEEIGGWGVPAERVGEIREMDVQGDGSGAIRFDALDANADRLANTVENAALQAALWAALEGRAELLSRALPTGVRFGDDAVAVQLADGGTITARLLVAADGGNSWVRDAAGIGFMRQPYGQCGVVANFECELPHRNIARQWFRSDGVLAWLPLPGRRISMVWSTDDAHAAEVLQLSDADLEAQVACAGARALGELRVLAPAAAFPLSLGRAHRVVGRRLVLVGDAAHTVHPLAGQGVNLGFGDARALAQSLDRARACDPGQDHVLARYARSRAEAVWATQTLCDGLQRLFGTADPALAALRNVGLNVVNHAGPLKRVLMRRAFQ